MGYNNLETNRKSNTKRKNNKKTLYVYRYNRWEEKCNLFRFSFFPGFLIDYYYYYYYYFSLLLLFLHVLVVFDLEDYIFNYHMNINIWQASPVY
jgi:hypothetical protein